MPVEAVIKAGLPHGMDGADHDAIFDWDYACEFDNTETAMMIIRELLSDGTT